MIRAENLTKYYSDLCAVDHINLDIKKGEIVGFLGPNGAGKTTTMRMLTGFLKPTSGSIRIMGHDIEENQLEIKRRLGYLPESAPLYHEMLAYDYLRYASDIGSLKGGEKSKRINELAGLCGIRDVMHKTIDELSKGYKQRVGLAHAMINDPEILILDEPTSGLDPNQIVEIREIIKEIGREKTVLLSTHILSEAEATCDRVIIIDKGKIALDAEIDKLKQSIGNEYIINITLKNAVLEDVEREFHSVEWIAGINVSHEDNGVLRIGVACRSPEDMRGDLYMMIKNREWTLLEFQKESRSLEKIFMELTREN
ncbi:MAG: ATP-binding cassette domain-containing protein [Deltaproteobacteria bacterium]|nr:ATP-binding cassette domain-containing protein [Deltaproteobacteria bacterium]